MLPIDKATYHPEALLGLGHRPVARTEREPPLSHIVSCDIDPGNYNISYAPIARHVMNHPSPKISGADFYPPSTWR
ncbi:hypothetical protein E2P81_ATG05628 [Venturia nashicola]|nr:hypothetical protein E2P81_ATG05628 [Venturia nashicola]